ncbi:type IV pilus prepilin peptidase PilD [marine gamma proteobacterium HTCC2143]|uniref:Prepilin leader peptidase/N-methyltransferase n=1 Tax=marine gamma proteobacterium HTCC2143 TaxID=247633 RepID=A0YF06_9GAMM|nr:type IV pilus prepilin peptidase PilD [marine gamma proteobacterium HTCC2143]
MDLLSILQAYPVATVAIVIVIGLLVGSFLNVVIYRLPVMMEREWKSECKLILDPDGPDEEPAESFNLAFPHSHCPNCDAPIRAWQNIPVISYVLLRGQCANCKVSISARYPIIEAVTALMSAVIAWQLGASLEMLAALFFTWSLIALTMIDADHKLLPDQITLPLLWAGLLLNSFSLFVPLYDAVWGAIGGYLSLWSVYWLFKILTGKDGMGYGDFKLLAALGAWLGWQSLLVIILLSSLVGAIVGSIILLANKQGRNTAIPFGPYLAAAGWIAFLWGDQIIDAYLRFSGLS